MKILIIGSKGFIGSHAVQFFKNQHYEVMGCDVVTEYNDSNYFQIDATNSDYTFLFEKTQVDICINCSGAASVPLSLQFPLKDFTLNTLNVFKILEAIRNHQPNCKFINLSSAAVYGNPVYLPINENAVVNPLSPYGVHKLHAEQICKEFNAYYQLQTCSVRIFSAYGNGLKKQLLWDLFQKFKTQPVVELYGTGDETRDFIHIEDLLQALLLIVKNASFNGETVNLANGINYSIAYIAELYRANLKSDKKIIFNQQVKQGDPLHWIADISKITAMGYVPNKTIEVGVNEYIHWAMELNNSL